MSVLQTPRIYFKGSVTWDPIVTNNYDTNYNENAGEAVLSGAADAVKAFRAKAVDAVNATDGNWNPHGTHRALFYDSAIGGFDDGGGASTSDPFVSAAADFTGMLVDLEPFGSFSSQLFFDEMSFGVEGGYRIFAPRSSRVTARHINFRRNRVNTLIAGVASVVWQTSFAKAGGLQVDAFDSKILGRLSEALASDDVLGLTVRFNTYRTVYFDEPDIKRDVQRYSRAAQSLQDKLRAGGFQPNPARSLHVGVIGLWRRGEPAHEPGDRVLVSADQGKMATAFARVDAGTATLDLSNSVPEISDDLEKLNLGTLSLVAVDDAGNASELCSIPYERYNRAAYEASAGLVTTRLPDGSLDVGNRNLELRDPSGAVLATEMPLRALPEMPNLYINEGETTGAVFRLYRHGLPVADETSVTMYKMSADGGTIELTTTANTDSQGILKVPVTASSGGIFAYVPSVAGVPPAPQGGIDPQTYTYMYVRALPADASTALLPPTWENVYNGVLANWNAMAPCMDNWVMLDDPAQIRRFAAILKRLTNPRNFESFRFMPVTRDMTLGERTLLTKYLDQPEATESAETLSLEKPEKTFTQLSREMRGGPL
jgi:hypothetical protein